MTKVIYNGRMMRQVKKSVKSPGGVEIYFGDAMEEKKAEIHHYGIGLPATPFFGLSKKQIKEAVKEIQKIIHNLTGKKLDKKLYALGGDLIKQIDKRTMAGKGIDGGSQRKYSKNYNDWRSSQGLKAGSVRLYVEHNMLGAMQRRKI